MMIVKARTLLPLVLVAACVVLAGSNAYAQNDPPGVDRTHYWTYHLIDPFTSPQPVALSDQFFRNPVPNTTDSLLRLVNWVYKNNSVVQDTFLHYTWWNLASKYPLNQFVRVTNQFGVVDVHVVQMDFLLAPAWKNQHPPVPGGPNANHYVCYKTTGPTQTPQTVVLHDEWRNDAQTVGPLEFLCVPCLKQHQGQTFVPVDTVTHLALYRIQPTSDIFIPFIQDQFAQVQRPVQQFPIEYLMVPSLKTPISTPTRKESWGRIKTLYR
jgi:hypothetical protein